MDGCTLAAVEKLRAILLIVCGGGVGRCECRFTTSVYLNGL